MNHRELNDSKPTRRQYPHVYEKVIPIALVILGLATVFMLFVSLAVLLGIFAGSG